MILLRMTLCLRNEDCLIHVTVETDFSELYILAEHRSQLAHILYSTNVPSRFDHGWHAPFALWAYHP